MVSVLFLPFLRRSSGWHDQKITFWALKLPTPNGSFRTENRSGAWIHSILLSLYFFTFCTIFLFCLEKQAFLSPLHSILPCPCRIFSPYRNSLSVVFLAREGPLGNPTLRAKGTLISEPRFSTPCEMRFFPREKGKMAFVKGFSLKRPFSLSRVGKIASRRG